MRFVFHEFRLSDVDDPDVYAAQPIYEWQQTEQGRWIMEHAHDLVYNLNHDVNYWGYRVTITGELAQGPDLTYYLLKWSKSTSQT
jgi:hypothetical protein